MIPHSLRVLRPTVTSLAKQPQHAARFRLDALADAFFAPLHELLGKKRYMLSEEKPSSLDCVAVAYLALAFIPPVPQKWLAETMIARYPGLCSYVKRLTKESFGGPVELGDAIIGLEENDNHSRDAHAEGWQSSKKLPWRKPAQKSLRDAGTTLLSGTISTLPLVKHVNRGTSILDHGGAGGSLNGPDPSSSPQSLILPSLLVLGSAIAAVGGYLLYSDVVSQPRFEKKNLAQMGDAGAMLDMGVFGDHNASSLEEGQREGGIPVGLKLDVEVDEPAA